MAIVRNPRTNIIESTDAQIIIGGTGSVSFAFPAVDGTNGQAIVTDGSGTLSFATVGGAQNLWETITSDSGSTVANTATDTLTIAGGTGISTAVSGDTLTITATGALQNIVEDTTPQLGGSLDVNGNSIVSVSAGDIAITPDTTGEIILDGLKWPQADGTVNQIIETDGTGQLSFVTPSGGGGGGGGGLLLQRVFFQDGAVATGTTTIPNDDTIPQQTEGTEFMTLSITPTRADSILRVYVTFNSADSTGGTTFYTCLFRDATSDAVACSPGTAGGVNFFENVHFIHEEVSGSTSTTTFKVRAGTVSAGTVTFNGQASAARLGGTMASSIVIEELAPSASSNVITTQTTDATQTTIGSISVTEDTSTSFKIRGHGRENATGDTLSTVIQGCIRNEGGTTALVGALDAVVFEDAGATAWDITAEANDGTDALDIKVTGEAAHTIDWKLTTTTIEE